MGGNFINNAVVNLPASKSISNRVLVIQALIGEELQIANLSNAEDTINLNHTLNSELLVRNIGEAGTAFRFCCALFSILKPGTTYLLTGAPSLRLRPIAPLVSALKDLGADITYADKQGFAPLVINGKALSGGEITINANLSSQFVSALCLIAPYLQNGLTIKLNNITSEPYVLLTLKLMAHFGISYSYKNSIIKIEAQAYEPQNIVIENDWSGASFFYACLMLQNSGTIHFDNLNLESLQGDSYVATLAAMFGIASVQQGTQVKISKVQELEIATAILDLNNYPDMALPIIVACALKYNQIKFTGLHTLLVKESNRIAALQTELSKIGMQLMYENDVLSFEGILDFSKEVVFNTHNDHRIEMALSLISFYSKISFDGDSVVNKSFPNYWMEFAKVFKA